MYSHHVRANLTQPKGHNPQEAPPSRYYNHLRLLQPPPPQRQMKLHHPLLQVHPHHYSPLQNHHHHRLGHFILMKHNEYPWYAQVQRVVVAAMVLDLVDLSPPLRSQVHATVLSVSPCKTSASCKLILMRHAIPLGGELETCAS